MSRTRAIKQTTLSFRESLAQTIAVATASGDVHHIFVHRLCCKTWNTPSSDCACVPVIFRSDDPRDLDDIFADQGEDFATLESTPREPIT